MDEITYKMLINVLIELVFTAESIGNIHGMNALMLKSSLCQDLVWLSHWDLALVTDVRHLLINSNLL